MKNKFILKLTMFVMLQSLAFATLFAQSVCKQVFNYTGADQTFTVPLNVHQITIKLWGAGGAGGNYVFNDIGGGGGFATATFNVVPGEQYIIIVGGAGLTGAGPGAYGGGGTKANGAGGRGGGRSALRNASLIELITAGAGGGGGGGGSEDADGKGFARGGAGGGLTGSASYWSPFNGNPGTQTEGGAGGVWSIDGLPHGSQAGGQFFGGNTLAVENGYNGSGGGGYFGGGSGTDIGDGSGGGGSSYIPFDGNTISGIDEVPGNISDPDYAGAAGYGGAKASAGNPGLVVILWNSIFYRDADSDGYGDINNSVQNCSQPDGYVADSSDCNDNDATIEPGATEILGDSIDNNCNGIVDEVNISGNFGNQSWEDPTFWQAAGLNGIPDSTSVINILGTASGNLNINGNAEMNSLIIDSTSSATVSFGTNTITISEGKLTAPKMESIDAKQASVVLKGSTTMNTKAEIGNLRIASGKEAAAKVILKQDTHVSNDLVLSAPVVQIEGSKQIEIQKNMNSSSEVTGEGKISFTGSETSTISAPPGKPQGKLRVDKPSGGKVQPITPVQAEEITVSVGELQLTSNQVTAPINIEGGKVTGIGNIKGAVKSKKALDSGTSGVVPTKSAIRPGNSPGLITIEGDLEMDSTDISFELFGTEPGTGYDQIKVLGVIKIGSGVTLDLTADSIPNFEFVVIDNDNIDAVDGRFEGLPNNGDTITISGNLFRIYYNGGDGNDVTLKMNNPVPVIEQCSVDTSVCQNNNTVEYIVLTNTIPIPDFTYSFSGATYAEAGSPGTGSGSTFNTGITNVVITATNAFGSATCSFNVEVTNSTWYADVDGDGFGDANNSIQNCSQPSGYITNSDDCDDNDNAIYPGAPEICDGKDNDCNGIIDDGLLTTYFRDSDTDGYGDPVNSIQACVQPAGYITNNTDCNDNDAGVYPGAPELCDGKDNNCNGSIDEGATYYRDADGDGYGNIAKPRQSCIQPPGYVTNNTDCKDNNAAIYPGATEVCGNNIDDNCNGQTDEGCAVISVTPQPASLTEGNSGKTNMTFVVSLSAPAKTASSVSYQTANVTATAGSDYVAKSGTLNFAKGQSSKTVVVKIIGDRNIETNETFDLVLSNPVNLALYQNKASGTIINDDGASFAKQTLHPKYNDPKNEGSKLVIPTLLQRNQIWSIQGLPASNTIILIDNKGQTVFKATNYKNNTGFNNLAVGLYYYQIMLKDKDGKPKLYRGKLMIIP